MSDKQWKKYQREIQKAWDDTPGNLSYLAQPDMNNPEYVKERKERIKCLRALGMNDLADELDRVKR